MCAEATGWLLVSVRKNLAHAGPTESGSFWNCSLMSSMSQSLAPKSSSFVELTCSVEDATTAFFPGRTARAERHSAQASLLMGHREAGRPLGSCVMAATDRALPMTAAIGGRDSG